MQPAEFVSLHIAPRNDSYHVAQVEVVQDHGTPAPPYGSLPHGQLLMLAASPFALRALGSMVVA